MKWETGFLLWRDREEIAKSLFGILPKDADLQEARKERLETEKIKNLSSGYSQSAFATCS